MNLGRHRHTKRRFRKSFGVLLRPLSAPSSRRCSKVTARRRFFRGTAFRSRTRRIAASSPKMSKLLLEFGVVTRLCRYAKGEIKVVIGNRRDARLFAERVGFLGAKQRKLERILINLPNTEALRSFDRVPHVAKYIRSECESHWIDK